MIARRSDISSETSAAPGRSPGLAARALFVLACGIALAIPVARASAQSVDGLNDKIAAAKEKSAALNDEIEQNVVALAQAKQEASRAAGRESDLTAVLAKGQERSKRLADKLAEAEDQLAAARDRFDRAQQALADRLVDIYTQGDVSEIDVLLDADGYADLTSRAELLGRIESADRALAERVRSLRDDVADQVSEVEQAKQRSDELNADVAAARDQIAAARAEAEARAAAAADAKAAQAASVEQLQGHVDDWSKQVQELEQESADDAAEEVGGWNNFGDWAIPEAIVMCESGGNYQALNPSSGAGGAYQILPSTWRLYGGKGLPNEAPPAEQDRIAAMIWADSGPSAWECAG